MRPQLADEVDATPATLDAHVEAFLANDRWAVEQKADGHRVLIEVVDGRVTALGRDGLPKANGIPQRVIDEFSAFPHGTWMFDGELVGQTLWLFDMPLVSVDAAKVTPSNPLRLRRQVLEGFFQRWAPGPAVRLLEQYRDEPSKRAAYLQFRREKVEGAMLKNLDGKYRTDGRRSMDVLKAKFTNTIDCFITDIGIDGKENAELSVWPLAGPGSDETPVEPVRIGKCSLLGKPHVDPWQVVEVQYLYASDDNRLVQPRLKRVRDDKRPDECRIDQLVHHNRSVLDRVL